MHLSILSFLLACSDPTVAAEPAVTPAVTPASTEAPAAAAAVATVGQPAPDFTLSDTDGNVVKLADFRGKVVVLEWYNPDCPFVVYAHGNEGPLKSLPKKWTDQGVVWLAINSNSPGSQGSAVDRNKASRTEYGMPYPVLLDPDGAVGKAYGSKNTPTMYVIDAEGNLAYQGALDDAPRGEAPGVIQTYTDQAITDVLAGRKPSPAQTKAYGCSVKYGS